MNGLYACLMLGFVATHGFTLSTTASAQAPDPGTLPPGSHVRITAPSLELDQAPGSMVRSDVDSFLVRLDGRRKALWIPRNSLTAMDIGRSDRSTRIAGTLLGAVMGGLAGGVIGHSLSEDRPADYEILSMSEDSGTAFGVLAGLVLGGTAGTLVGSAVAREHWEPIQLGGPNLGIRIRPTPGRQAVALSVRIPLGEASSRGRSAGNDRCEKSR